MNTAATFKVSKVDAELTFSGKLPAAQGAFIKSGPGTLKLAHPGAFTLGESDAATPKAEAKAAQGGFYTRDQIHALEVGNLVLDVDSASGTERVGVQLMETSNLSDPTSWRPVGMTTGNLDVGSDGTVGLNVPATGNAKFFKVVVPQK